MNKNVFIALSGGVDSSVAASLLCKQGYNCTGVYMKLFNDKDFKDNKAVVKSICKKINIPLKIYDFRKEFEQKIIVEFINEYKKGKTPNPCIICNQKFKFGLFLHKAMKDGADMIATGHYVRKAASNHFSDFKILRGKDKAKDQSYFLYRLNQKQLSKSLFPLGNYTKKQVRNLAKKMNLLTSDRKESQEICFLTNKKLKDFLEIHIRPKEGDIITVNGKRIGTHDGYFNFTIGQREGLGIGGGTPYYVVALNASKNQVIVAKGSDNSYLFKSIIQIEKPHWISDRSPKLPLKCKVSIRYNHNPLSAVLKKANNKYTIHFKQSQRAPTPGQSAVIYEGDECLGGEIIL